MCVNEYDRLFVCVFMKMTHILYLVRLFTVFYFYFPLYVFDVCVPLGQQITRKKYE